MGFQLSQQFGFCSFETQLNQLASKIVAIANQLHIWTIKLIEFRALQMDGLIDEYDDINQRIDMMEAYVKSSNLILQNMAQTVVCAKQSFCKHQSSTFSSMTIQQEKFLEYHSTVVDKLLANTPTV